jgi:hypothetical protein
MGCQEADVAVDVVVNEGQASHPFRYLECTRFYDPKGPRAILIDARQLCCAKCEAGGKIGREGAPQRARRR